MTYCYALCQLSGCTMANGALCNNLEALKVVAFLTRDHNQYYITTTMKLYLLAAVNNLIDKWACKLTTANKLYCYECGW